MLLFPFQGPRQAFMANVVVTGHRVSTNFPVMKGTWSWTLHPESAMGQSNCLPQKAARGGGGTLGRLTFGYKLTPREPTQIYINSELSIRKLIKWLGPEVDTHCSNCVIWDIQHHHQKNHIKISRFTKFGCVSLHSNQDVACWRLPKFHTMYKCMSLTPNPYSL